MRKQTNLLFFQQDLINQPKGVFSYDNIARTIEHHYKTICYMCNYSYKERKRHAEIAGKKFGFVLTKLK